ncbi:hypothetical protein [Borreliella valaisiana]|uniref:hypothetical protein n=1 Tax=Borreliella valaisiana TaxID=62088 RepID=UPI003BA05E53
MSFKKVIKVPFLNYFYDKFGLSIFLDEIYSAGGGPAPMVKRLNKFQKKGCIMLKTEHTLECLMFRYYKEIFNGRLEKDSTLYQKIVEIAAYLLLEFNHNIVF